VYNLTDRLYFQVWSWPRCDVCWIFKRTP